MILFKYNLYRTVPLLMQMTLATMGTTIFAMSGLASLQPSTKIKETEQ